MRGTRVLGINFGFDQVDPDKSTQNANKKTYDMFDERFDPAAEKKCTRQSTFTCNTGTQNSLITWATRDTAVTQFTQSYERESHSTHIQAYTLIKSSRRGMCCAVLFAAKRARKRLEPAAKVHRRIRTCGDAGERAREEVTTR